MASTEVAKLNAEHVDELIESKTHTQRAIARLKRDYLTLAAFAVLGIMGLMIIFADPISVYLLNTTPNEENLQLIYAPPGTQSLYSTCAERITSARLEDMNQELAERRFPDCYAKWQAGENIDATRTHWLGTDNKGRDHVSRLLFGGQISLKIAVLASMLSMFIGVSLGIITGYYGGLVDDFFIWFITTLGSIPGLFLLLLISSLLSPGPDTLILILGLLGWTGTMRLVRGETLALREREFVVAARSMGASDLRLMFRHIFPNLISIVVVTMAIDIGVLILTESGLSFLGFGVAPPDATWGNMLTKAQDFYRKAPWLVFAPGLAITITVLCLYVIGDGIRDALDPTISD